MKDLLGPHHTSYITPCLVTSAKPTNRFNSIWHTKHRHWDTLGCSERKILMLPCREEKISMGSLESNRFYFP